MEDEYTLNADLNTEKGRASYFAEINKIKNSAQPAEAKLNLLNILIKDFMRKRFHTKKTDEYSELIDFFIQKNKTHMAVFCHEMVKQMYSGEILDQNSVSVLCDEAKKMIERELYYTPEKKENSKDSSSLFDRLKKKKKVEDNSPKTIGKEAEKAIEKALQTEQSIKMEKSDDDGKYGKEKTILSDLSLNSDLSMNQSPETVYTDSNEEKQIRTIDDLERIKRKIQSRKIEVAQIKAASAKQEISERK